MRIKEVAALCGLTEKAIRLYEEKGLITPTLTEKNGRMFRDYDENTVAALKTVAALRRAFFSLEQIAEMQNAPDRIPEIFAAYKAELQSNYVELSPLLRRAENADETAFLSAESVSVYMTAAETGEDGGSGAETVPSFHFRVWDEEMSRDERAAAYVRCEKYLAHWGRSYGAYLVFDELCMILKRNRKRVTLGILTVLALFWALYCVPLPVYVNETVTGYEMLYGEDAYTAVRAARESFSDSADVAVFDVGTMPMPAVCTERTVTLHGWSLYYLFKEDVFTGYVDITGYSQRQTPIYTGTGYDDITRQRVRFPIRKHEGIAAVSAGRITSSGGVIHVRDDFAYGIRYLTLFENRIGGGGAFLLSEKVEYTERGMIDYHSAGMKVLLFTTDASLTAVGASQMFWERIWKTGKTEIIQRTEKGA